MLIPLALVGCTSLALPDKPQWFDSDAVDSNPTRIVAVWTDTIMHQPGQPGVRGVGGRLLFYGADSETSLKVNGTLSVYVYDDAAGDAHDTAPARKFVFLPDQLANRHSTSQFGDSYNVWIPWDEVGNPARQLTLIARFEPESGAVVLSDPTRQLLPGEAVTPQVSRSIVGPATPLEDSAPGDVTLAGYDSSPGSHDDGGNPRPASPASRPGLETFSIDLPADVAGRWHAQINAALTQPQPAPQAGPTAASGAAQKSVGDVPSGETRPQTAPAEPGLDAAGRRVESAAPAGARRRMPAPNRVANPYSRSQGSR